MTFQHPTHVFRYPTQHDDHVKWYYWWSWIWEGVSSETSEEAFKRIFR